VNAIGNNTGITAGSGLSSFSSPSVGNNFRLQVTGTSGDFLANTVGDGLGVSVSGDMTKVFVQGRIGTGGSVSVGGSLSTFNAYTVGDGFGLNVANDLTTLVTNSLGAGSGITAGRNVGNVYSYSSIGNGSTIIIQGALGNFQGATIGNDFHLDVTGTMGAFRSNVLGARPTISVGGSASLISVSNVGTGGHIIVGGTLSKFNASIVGDALDVNVTGDLPYFNANTAGAGLKVSVGGSLTNMFIQKSSLKDATITAGQGIAGIYAYQGGIQGASTITANGTAGIGTVSASAGGFSGTLGAPKGNITQLRANGDVNATINSSGTLGALTILGGSVPSPRKLSGLIDVRVISSIYGVYTEMENLTIRATDSNAGISVQSMKDVILSAGAIGSLRASQDVTGTRPNSSLILAGYDIGPDLAFGGPDDGPFTSGAATGDITRLYIGGTVQNSTVRAGGNIQTLIMGATTHSNFIAGASVEAFRENKPCATEPSDFADPQATIAALQVVGVTTGGGGIATPAMSDSNFSAPNYGNLSLLNGPDWNAFAVIVLDNQNHIQSVTYRDTTDSQNNWYWQPGQEWKGGTPLDVITPSRWTFAFMADFRTAHTGTGVNVTAATAIAGQASGFGVDFALAAGDLVEGLTSSWPDNIGPSLDQQFKSFKAAMVAGGLYLAGDTSGSGIPYYPVRGNHELHHEIHPEENILQVWMDNFGNYVPQNGPAGEVGLTYAFTYGNGVFLMVDEYVNLMIVNQPWVDQQLAANAGQQQVFAVGHTAAFALAAAETLADNPAQRDALLTSLYNAGERVFLAGHDHLSARADVPVIDSTGTAIGTMEQIITPSGAPFMPVPWDGQYRDSRVVPREFVDATMGYQLVKVDGPNVTVEFWGTTDGCTRTWDPVTQEYNYTYSTDSTNWTWSKVDSYTFSGT
jgi:hypothetical protein